MAPKILLVADDLEFAEALKADEKCKSFVLQIATTFEDALSIVENGVTKFNCIFINPKLSEGSGAHLIGLCHAKQTSVPIYLILDSLKQLGDELTEKDVGIQGLLKSPEEIVAIAKIIETGMNQFDFQKAIAVSKSVQDPIEESSEGTLVGILAVNFLSGSKSFFDVFVKIGNSKFIKILDAGEGFEASRLNRYLEKGLEYLYIKKEAQKYYLDFCDKLTTKILKSDKVSSQVKVAQTLNQGHEVMGFLQHNELDSDSIQYAINFSNNVTSLLKTVGEKDKSVKAFLQNIATFEHCAGGAIIAGLLARKLDFGHDECINVLGIAATLHDIGLYKINNVFDNFESEHAYYNEEELELELKNPGLVESRRRILLKAYHDHPLKGAELVQKIAGINPLVPQIIAQHHERNNGTGFPGLVKSQMVNSLSQLIGVADEFTKVIKLISSGKVEKTELLNFPNKLDGFSKPVRRAWESQFLKR
ncbi:MAG: HD domain-containing phosphohydrolase [Bacteriovoracaceae bacterium]